ncbi:MAG: hypothetical protein COT74_11670 [Bdellovibrionales bacterium CG10_big_fil_rev_8_21_14_0_10_45_34]|nr:MAG: hypothetical protein COT74_11670 [Bdellovibrionales bacterium CG10_big_fil_rev_8_21_14_0_10_45_34]
MSATIYKIVSSAIATIVVGRVLFLVSKQILLLARKLNSVTKRRLRTTIEISEGEKNKKWFAEYQCKEKEKRDLVEREHYQYKGTYVNLSTIQRDRKTLFESRWTNWKFNKDNCELNAPGDYHSQCLKMFGEMSHARKAIIAKDPTFWNQEKERFWIKICHPQIKNVDIHGQNLFDTRQRILAEEEFNQDDGDDRSSA